MAHRAPPCRLARMTLAACACLLSAAASSALPSIAAFEGQAGSLAMPSAASVQIAATPLIRADNNTRFVASLNPVAQAQADVQGQFELLDEKSRVVGVHLSVVPDSDKFLFMERPSAAPFKTRQIAGTFDLVTREWVPVDSPDGLFCCGHSLTADGEVAVIGGHKESGGFPSGMMSVRLFGLARNATALIKTTTMGWKRWYPSVTLLPDARILIMGGTPTVGGSGGGNPYYELFTPTNPTQHPLPYFKVDTYFVYQSKKMYYPFNFVLPTGDVFTFSERVSRILIAATGEYRTVNGSAVHGPKLPGSYISQFPFTATVAFTPLTPANNYSAVDFIVFGGAKVAAIKDNTILAGRQSRRMTISWSRPDVSSNWTYSFSNWVIEDLGIPRVMGDATLLPNGDIVLQNGGQEGLAGDAGGVGGSGGRADYPALWAQLYQPDAPQGARVSALAGSPVARMYHSTAVLTSNGTILIAGCDRCFRLHSDYPDFVSSNRSSTRFEYRIEVFHPPYVFYTSVRPAITAVNGGVRWLAYDTLFTVEWGAEDPTNSTRPPVTSVVMVAPSSTTHSFNMNQRVVVLPLVGTNYEAGVVTVRTPPHPYVLPPQWVLLFALNGKVYSKGVWVQLKDTRDEGKALPPGA